MTTPTENWPKPFLLQCHEQAVKHGFIWLEGMTEADAHSFRQRFYRIRRRSDKAMAAFIPPEYHLVMVGQWEATADGLGRLPILYNRKADGSSLPTITIASGEEVEAYTAPPALAEPAPMLDTATLPVELGEGEIEDLVAKMRKAAAKRQGEA